MKEEQKDFKHIVRVMNTDLDGAKPIGHALGKIKGVSFMFSNAICKLTKIPATKKTGYLSEDEVKKLNEAISNPLSIEVPLWMLNRRNDPDTGEDMHLIGTDLRFVTENDVKMMKKIRSYKGVRHSHGQPVRGQRTKSNFRTNKGKGSLGVIKKAKSGAVAAAAATEAGKDKKPAADQKKK
jgi:small subunit ribosomal protein S13